MTVKIFHGECVAVMRGMEAASVDAVVTDPPYGLQFMGKDWDKIGKPADWGEGHGIVKTGMFSDRPTAMVRHSHTRQHREANPTCATCGGRKWGAKKCHCEEPDWRAIGARRGVTDAPEGMTGGGMNNEVRAMQAWHETWAREAFRVLRSGGHLVAFGGTRTYHRLTCAIEDAGFEIRDAIGMPTTEPGLGLYAFVHGQGFPKSKNLGNGFGSALKPAWEPIVVARKPLIGSLESNVARYGTGGINVDATRIGTTRDVPVSLSSNKNPNADYGPRNAGTARDLDPNVGRWPANVVLTHLSLPVLRLSAIIPSEVSSVIRGYFDGYDINTSDPVVRQLRSTVYGPARLGQERAAEILHEGMPHAAPDDATGQGLLAARNDHLARSQGQDRGGGSGTRAASDRGGEAASHANDDNLSLEGIPARPYQQPLCRGSSVGAGDGDREEGNPHPRTPTGDGSHVGASAQAERDGSPHQRGEVGQLAGELREAGRIESFAIAPGASSGDRTPTTTERPLDVLARDVPPAWLCYFERTGIDLGCREVGVRRVKGITGTAAGKMAGKSTDIYGEFNGSERAGERTGYASPDGFEEVAAWECAPGCPVAELDRQSGERVLGGQRKTKTGSGEQYGGGFRGRGMSSEGYADTGGASRFFYTAKASRSERAEGLPKDMTNGHPTVKPVELARWLVKLCCPPGGIVLDPFLGSGSIGCAAVAEGFDFVGIEQEAEYVEIATRRIDHWSEEGQRRRGLTHRVGTSSPPACDTTDITQLGLPIGSPNPDRSTA